PATRREHAGQFMTPWLDGIARAAKDHDLGWPEIVLQCQQGGRMRLWVSQQRWPRRAQRPFCGRQVARFAKQIAQTQQRTSRNRVAGRYRLVAEGFRAADQRLLIVRGKEESAVAPIF